VNTTRGIKALTVLSVSVVLVSAFSWLALGQVSGSIKRIDVFGKLDSRPEKTSKALNYLLVGSDTREGLTKEQMKVLRVGSTKTAAGGRSDTMLLVHISKARDKAMIVSLPRDSLVTIPAHRSSDGTKDIGVSSSKLNAAFAWGGNFAGFAKIVDALGGIEVCTKKDIDDPKSHLVLAAGVHTLNGIESLKYVRTRDIDGLGDIGRMQRQQQFMSSVLRKATSTGVLLNPIKLVNFFNAAISTVKTDSALNESDLLTLAKQLRNLSASKVRTLTVPIDNPNAYAEGVGSVVTWDPVLAGELFQRLRDDLPIVDEVVPSPNASATAKPEKTIIDKFKTRTADENPCGELK